MHDAAYIRVPLRAKDGSIRGYTTIDQEDAHLAGHRWYLDSSGYAQRYIGRFDGKARLLGMHRAVLGLRFGDGMQADHINGDRLDNRRSNLRAVTLAENRQNRCSKPGSSSRYRGVSWDGRRQVWRAYATINYRLVQIGQFADEEAAARAARAYREAHMSHTAEDARA